MPGTTDVAGWRQDPTGDHKYRYHDGTAFTRHVSDHDVVGLSGGDVAHPSTGSPPADGDFANQGTFEPSSAPPRASAQQTLSPPVYGGAWAPLPVHARPASMGACSHARRTTCQQGASRRTVVGGRCRHSRSACDRSPRDRPDSTLGPAIADRVNRRAVRFICPKHGPRRLLEQLRAKRALGNGLSELQHIGNCVE